MSGNLKKGGVEDPTRDKIIAAMLDSYPVEEIVEGLINVTAMREAVARKEARTWDAQKWGHHAARFREVRQINEVMSRRLAV